MKFSIVVPTSDKVENLVFLINCFLRINYSFEDFEVIVINNSKGRRVERLISKIIKKFNYLDICVVTTLPLGPSYARNIGVKIAKFDHIIFTDDDCLLPKNFLKEYKRAWESDPDSRIIGGRVHIGLRNNNISNNQFNVIKNNPWCFAYLDLGNRKKILKQEALYSSNFSIRKTLSDLVNGVFNEDLGMNIGCNILFGTEDAEFCIRTQLLGLKIVYSPTIYVTNIVKKSRFSSDYLKKRYFFMGIENYRMEFILQQNFKNFKNTFRNEFFKERIYWIKLFLRRKEKTFFTFSYFFLGRMFV